MTKSTPVPIDGRDVILRDKYRAIVAEYSSEIVEILQAVKYDTEADTARLVKCVRDLDNDRWNCRRTIRQCPMFLDCRS